MMKKIFALAAAVIGGIALACCDLPCCTGGGICC